MLVRLSLFESLAELRFLKASELENLWYRNKSMSWDKPYIFFHFVWSKDHNFKQTINVKQSWEHMKHKYSEVKQIGLWHRFLWLVRAGAPRPSTDLSYTVQVQTLVPCSLSERLGQTIYFSGPQFLHLQHKDNHSASHVGFLWRLNINIIIKKYYKNEGKVRDLSPIRSSVA